MNFDSSGAMTGDADAAFGADGRLYVLNLAFNNPPAQPANPTVYVFAASSGLRFEGPARFPLPHGEDQPDRPWLVPDPYEPSRVLVTNSEGAGDAVAWTSTDHAHTFSGPTLITGTEHAASIELASRPFFDVVNYNRIFMLYESTTAEDTSIPAMPPLGDFPLTQLWLAESDDAGTTWNNHLVLDITNAFGPAASGGSLGHVLPASAIDDAGNLYAAFSLRMGGSTATHVFLIHSSDHGVTWSAPAQVDSGSLGSNVMPALAAGAPGRVDLSWYGSTSVDFTDSSARWVEMFAQSMNALAGTPSFATSQVSGVTHVGTVDTSGNPGSNLYDWGLRDFQSIAIDRAGAAHLAWTDTGRSATLTARQLSGPSLEGPTVLAERQTKPATPRARPTRLPATGIPDRELFALLMLTLAAALAAALSRASHRGPPTVDRKSGADDRSEGLSGRN